MTRSWSDARFRWVVVLVVLVLAVVGTAFGQEAPPVLTPEESTAVERRVLQRDLASERWQRLQAEGELARRDVVARGQELDAAVADLAKARSIDLKVWVLDTTTRTWRKR